MIPVCRTAITVLCLVACAPPGAAMPPERSVSTSRQFLVYGPDIQLRGAICDLAEGTKHDILQLLGQRDAWITPIVIQAQYPQANWPEMPGAILSLSQTGFGLKLQLDLTISSAVVQSEIRRELLRAVLLEMMYRRTPDMPVGTAYTAPPDWLVDGLQARTSHITGALAAPLAAHKILSLEELLRQQPNSLDAAGRALYCAYSVALVELLIHTSDGRSRIARFISDIPASSDDGMAQLRRHFPELIDAAGRSRKTWLWFIARLLPSQSYRLLSMEESERILNEMLNLRISDSGSKKKYPLHEFPRFMRDAPAKPALIRLRGDLSAFSVRASPIYRPAILEYEKIATLLARGKTSGIAERVARLSAARKMLIAQMQKIDDYMNWFEATKSREPSGVFADYMKAADSADRLGEKRRDPISVYLDVLETQLRN